jgi:antitoxin ChpS
MLAVPPAILDLTHLAVGQTVAIEVDGDRLVLQPKPRRRYKLEELLAQCDPSAPFPVEDREWLDDRPVGRELL